MQPVSSLRGSPASALPGFLPPASLPPGDTGDFVPRYSSCFAAFSIF